jgi:hypothetical protein
MRNATPTVITSQRRGNLIVKLEAAIVEPTSLRDCFVAIVPGNDKKRIVTKVLSEDSILTHKLTHGDNCDL